jgi:hypothetical protein
MYFLISQMRASSSDLIANLRSQYGEGMAGKTIEFLIGRVD